MKNDEMLDEYDFSNDIKGKYIQSYTDEWNILNLDKEDKLYLAIITLLMATIGALLSELSRRYLFYRTVVPVGLAGNFFAGNQRH